MSMSKPRRGRPPNEEPASANASSSEVMSPVLSQASRASTGRRSAVAGKVKVVFTGVVDESGKRVRPYLIKIISM